VLEDCGFRDWLIRMLKEYRYHKVILIQSEDRKKSKMDRHPAAHHRPADGHPHSWAFYVADADRACTLRGLVGRAED
jgi:hypothetical protein